MNPFLAEAPPAAPAAPARKRGKPPPGIISAGGVDMARAHASNIRPAADTEGARMEAAKVVVSVETNPRRIKTMRNLEGLRPDGTGGPSPWAKGAEPVDKAALPSANVPRDAADEEKKKDKAGAFWLRLATVLVALLLIAGVVRRMRLYSQRNTPTTPTTTGGVLIPLPLPELPATGTGASTNTAPDTSGRRPGTLPPKDGEVIDLDEPTGEPSPEHTARPVRVRPPPPPPPPKPTFSPIFELPGEKN